MPDKKAFEEAKRKIIGIDRQQRPVGKEGTCHPEELGGLSATLIHTLAHNPPFPSGIAFIISVITFPWTFTDNEDFGYNLSVLSSCGYGGCCMLSLLFYSPPGSHIA